MNIKNVLVCVSIICTTVLTSSVTAKETLTFSSIPEGSRATQDEKYDLLLSYLEEKLDKKIVYFPVSDYAALTLAMKGGKVDFAYFGPKSYIDAARISGAKAIALETDEDGNPGYKGIIVVKKDSKYQSVADLKGTKFAFTDPSSTSGTLVPKVYFKNQGIKPETFFSDILFSGSHQASVKTLLLGKVGAVSTNDIDFNRGIEAGLWRLDNIRILWTSDLIPGSPYVVSSRLSADLQEKIKSALINYNNKEGLKRMAIGSIIETDDANYNLVREIIKISQGS